MPMLDWLESIGLVARRRPSLRHDNYAGCADPAHLLTRSEAHPGYVATSSGRLFDVVNPTPEQVDIHEIAYALANVNRFGGHTKWPYTVAQHSVYCAIECQRRYDTPHLELACLLHDAAEAYVGDVIRPVKRLIASVYRPIEDRVQAAIWQRFGLEIDADVERVIKDVDNAVVMAESAALMIGSCSWNWEGVDRSPIEIRRWSENGPYNAFMAKFRQLFGELESHRAAESAAVRSAAACLTA